MYTILQITDTAVNLTSLVAGVLLAVLTVVMAFIALGPYLPWSLGRELDTEAGHGRAADGVDAVDET